MEDQPPKPKRGRPRIKKVNDDGSEITTDRPKKTTVKAIKAKKNAVAPTPDFSKETTQTPIQLSIASYGKKTSSPQPKKHVAAATPNDRDRDRATPAPKSAIAKTSKAKIPIVTPIIVSLPVSNQMEEKNLNPATLDTELTSYNPDNLDRPVPRGIVSLGVGYSASFDNPSDEIILHRCADCNAAPYPCQLCFDKFNLTHPKANQTFKDYQEARLQDDKQLHGKTNRNSFYNEPIIDKPLPSTTEAPTYNPHSAIVSAVTSYVPVEGLGFEVDTSPQTSDFTDNDRQILLQRIEQLETQIKLAQQTPTTKSAPFPLNRHIDLNEPECLWHLEHFSTRRIGLPLFYNDTSATYESIGCFCSFECAYAYRLEHKSAEAAPLWLLFKAHREMDHSVIKPKLISAPNRQRLKRFGGTMDLDTFLKFCKTWPLDSDLQGPRFDFIVPTTSEQVNPNKTHTFELDLPTNTKNQSLVRKREKPHPNAANQWDNVIKLSKIRRNNNE